MRYLGKGAPPEKYTALGVERHSHLAVDYHRDAVGTSRGVGRGPDPQGVSGGGAWRCEGLSVGDVSGSRMVAIMTEWHRAPDDALLGTRIAPVLEAIRTQYPELSASIPRASSVNVTVRMPQGRAPI